MAAPEGYDTPTIPGMDDLAGRKTWFETGDGKPVNLVDMILWNQTTLRRLHMTLQLQQTLQLLLKFKH